jgi:hypothetical protein
MIIDHARHFKISSRIAAAFQSPFTVGELAIYVKPAESD